jgi:hypothetical protein
LPGQFSVRSQTSTAGRHGVAALAKPSAGQLLPPLHDSATSQTPAEGRQTAMLLASVGQNLLTPSQVSVRSQTPAEGRQTVPIGCGTSAGQFGLPPLQVSSKSHTWPGLAARQTTPIGWKPSIGQLALDPVHTSATSQAPVPGRQTWPMARNVQFAAQHEPVVPFAGPSSHCSPRPASIILLPHKDSKTTVTKCPSLACVRDPAPG